MHTPDFVKPWEDCLGHIRSQLQDEAAYRAWFLQIKPLRKEGDTLSVEVPTRFHCEWLEEHYIGLLSSAISTVLGPQGRLEYVIAEEGNKPAAGHTPSQNPYASLLTELQIKTGLIGTYTFETLLEGGFNRLVRTIGRAITENIGNTALNPCIIFGPVGNGKTHTLHAIGNAARTLYPDKRIVYLTTKQFTDLFVQCLGQNKMVELGNFFQSVDLLLLDDIQFLSGREMTQNLFFDTFNYFRQAGQQKQIVMTSDRPPRDLQGMPSRLLSRCKWGVTADLQDPDYETRLLITRQKLADEGVSLDPALEEYIALHVRTNIRELEGVIHSLKPRLTYLQMDPSLALVKKVIQDIIETPPQDTATAPHIQNLAANHFGVPLDVMLGKSRRRPVVVARQVSMYLVRKFCPGSTLEWIGKQHGGRDHTTVGHGIEMIKNLLPMDPLLRASIQELEKSLRQHLPAC